jgi:crotonobetainyl-CoA:carnitine CoA-transferase CaiB-like acyl-CoA transferase
VPVAPVYGLDQAMDNPWLVTTGMRDTVSHPDRDTIHVLANPIKVDGARLPNRAAPLLGADVDNVLAGAGYGADEIAELRAAGVV